MGYVFGLDPGARSGALAWVTHDNQLAGIANAEGDDENLPAALVELLAGADLLVVEKPLPYGMRKVSAASLMGLAASAATAVGVARALAVPVVLVQASVWKKELGVTSDKQTSISRAIELHGECKYLANRSRNKAGVVRPDHNHAEAQLLAYYGLLHMAKRMRATGTRSLR